MRASSRSLFSGAQKACDDYAKVLKRARATPQIRKDTHNKVGEYLLNHGAKLAAKKKRHDQGLSDYDDDDSAVSREGQNKVRGFPPALRTVRAPWPAGWLHPRLFSRATLIWQMGVVPCPLDPFSICAVTRLQL